MSKPVSRNKRNNSADLLIGDPLDDELPEELEPLGVPARRG